MRRVTTTIAVAAAVLGAAAPASATTHQYKFTQAEGFVRVTFEGDQAAGCADRGVCGVTGTVEYRFGGRPRNGFLDAVFNGSRPTRAAGGFSTNGATTADVATAGVEQHCVDSVPRASDAFAMIRSGSAMRFTWHGAFSGTGDDYLNTHCQGPSEDDLAQAGSLPNARFSYKPLRSKYSTFAAKGQARFSASGFANTVEWNLSYALTRRACSPRCSP
jgi:hypothetical protein